MTTIAYDGRCIAIDSQVTQGETKYSARKVWEITTPEGVQAVVFGSGTIADIQGAVAALKEGEVLPKGNYTLLVYEFDGKLNEYDGDDTGTTPMYEHWAAGSGTQAALAAMKMGASAGTAVEIAAEVDVSTGGPVVVFDTRTRKFRKHASRRKTTPTKRA